MKTNVSSTVPFRVCEGSMEQPLDILIQNNSVNNIYVSFDLVENVNNNGLKIQPGQSYTNSGLTRSLFVLADVDSTEIRYEVQQCKK